MRKRAAALLAGLCDRRAIELPDDGGFDFADDLHFRFARGAFLFVVEFLAQEKCLPGAGLLDVIDERTQRVDATRERIVPLLGIELDAQRPFLFAVDARQDFGVLLRVAFDMRAQRVGG